MLSLELKKFQQSIVVDNNCHQHIIARHTEVYPYLHTIVKLIKQQKISIIEQKNDIIRGYVNLDNIELPSGLIELNKKIDLDSPTLFAFRPGEHYPSHVSLKNSPKTSQIFVLLKKNKKSYSIVTAHPCLILSKRSPFNEDKSSNLHESLEFWMKHALTTDTAKLKGSIYVSTWRREIIKYVNINNCFIL